MVIYNKRGYRTATLQEYKTAHCLAELLCCYVFSIPYLTFFPRHVHRLSDSIFLSQNFQGIQLLHLEIGRNTALYVALPSL